MKIESTASGKAFFSGEYMALDGGRAIILSTPQSAKVSISENNERINILFSSMSDRSYPFLIDEKKKIVWLEEDPKHLGDILNEGISQFNKAFSGKSITIDTSDFFYRERKIGIGSSAAVSVALTKALNKLLNLRLASNAMIDYSRQIHNRSQDSHGSGFDVIASFTKERALSCQLYGHESYKHEKIQLPEEIKIFAVVNNACSQTSQMINRYEAAKKKYKDYFSNHAPKMKSELDHLHDAIFKNDSSSMMTYLIRYNELLLEMDNKFSIGVFDHHHELINLAKDHGVFYKPSGSGGGDLGLLISPDKIRLDKICKELASQGLYLFEI
ncbi:hypothetical protein OAU43_00225 [Gammaproteobacteria bacterium]|nr:hypothetical protein [Gammaproteobacteria bacterium]